MYQMTVAVPSFAHYAHITFSSLQSKGAHFKGKKHRKKMNQVELEEMPELFYVLRHMSPYVQFEQGAESSPAMQETSGPFCLES